jgi:hypothetical protein
MKKYLPNASSLLDVEDVTLHEGYFKHGENGLTVSADT